MRRGWLGFPCALTERWVGRLPLVRAHRLMLLVSGTGATLARSHAGRLQAVQLLPADAEGWLQLDAAVKADPAVPVYIAVDSVDEAYRSEVLPRVRGADWREMAARRLQQLLHQTPYRAALRQGRAPEVAAGERHLFVGLTAPALLEPWLDVLRLRQAPVAGIWLTPVLAQVLLRRLSIPHPAVLLVAAQGDDLRLSYFERGALRYSRLAPRAARACEDPLADHAEQIERTRRALLAQRIMRRGEPLHVAVLDPLDSLTGLPQRLTQPPDVNCEVIGRSRLLRRLKLSPDHLTQTGDVIVLSLLPDAPAAANLLPQDQRRPYQSHRLRQALRAASAASLTTGVLVAAVFGLDAWRQTQAAVALQAQAARAEAELARLLAGAPAASDLESAWRSHQAWHHVLARIADPAQPLAAVAAIVGLEPGIELLNLQWRGPDGQAGPVIELEAEITPFNGDYLTANRRIDNLLRRLAAAGWSSRVTQRPLEADRGQTIQGDFAQGAQQAAFRLVIVKAGRRT